MLTPHPHQTWAAQALLLNRRNVILQAPTGAGKFYGALLPYLNALQNSRDFPTKCIYIVPMRILADQFYEEARSAVRRYGLKINVTIQMGNRQKDREFEGDLIFTTIDQVLSSFLISPYSLSKRKANLNAGAILSAYLVFDEFHLFDPTSTLPTTLHMLQMLTGITPFLLMTATLSNDMLYQLKARLEKNQKQTVTIIPENEQQIRAIQAIQSQQKTRFYEAVRGNDDTPYPMTADSILDVHTGRSLVICNIVRRTRAMYTALQAEITRRRCLDCEFRRFCNDV